MWGKIMNKKVVLIEPPAPFASEPNMNPPLGLAYIGAYLKSKGITNIQAVDLTIPTKDYFDIPDDGDVYAVSGLTPQYKYMVEICDWIRQNNPKATIIVGGHHITTCPNDKPTSADYVVRGDGEEALLKIIQGESIDEQAIHRVTNINTLPFPDRDIFGLGNYVRTLNGEKAIHIITSRGCPFNCSFCDRESVGRKVRYRDIDLVLGEIAYVRVKYGIRAFVFYDDIFTLDKKRVLEFCKWFKNMNIIWRCWSRSDTISKELLQVMKDSGLVSITMGIESGDDIVLKAVDKGLTREKNRKALRWCKEVGVPIRCSLMFGNPGESWSTVQNTIDMIKECQPEEWNLAVLTPVPGSAIWNHPERFGIEFDREWVRRNQYNMTDRFSDSGIGSAWYKFIGKGTEDFDNMLKYFVSELEKVCPRASIQDTIQGIHVDKIKRK